MLKTNLFFVFMPYTSGRILGPAPSLLVRTRESRGIDRFCYCPCVYCVILSPAQGERNQMVNAKFTRPVNAMPISSLNSALLMGIHTTSNVQFSWVLLVADNLLNIIVFNQIQFRTLKPILNEG